MQLQLDSCPMKPITMIFTYLWQRYGTQLTPPPPYTNMSAPGNAAKQATAHSNMKTAKSCPSLVRIEPTMH